MQLTELLLGDHQPLFEYDDFDGDVSASLSKRQVRWEEASRSLAGQIIKAYPDPRDGLDLLSRFLDLIRLEEPYTQPATFLFMIGEVSLDYSYGLCEAILESPERSLARHFSLLVTPIRRLAPDKGLDLLRHALDSEQVILWSGVSSFYYQASWIESVCDEDVQLIERLLAHPNLTVRETAIGALWNLGKARPQVAKQLALSLDLEGDDRLADAFFMRLDAGIGAPLHGFDDQEIERLIEKLSNVQSLENHWINQFLVIASNRRPLSVWRMLLNRVDACESRAMWETRALPLAGFDAKLEGLPRAPAYPTMLREVRDRTLTPNRRSGFLIPHLFREITLNFSADCLPILDEWIEMREKDKVEAVAYLLKEAPHDFVFTQAVFVGRLLEIAQAIGHECFTIVSSSLQSPSRFLVKNRVRGQPFPEDIALRERASEMVKTCLPGSPQWRFYQSLADHGEDSIRRSRLHDAELE